MQQQHAAGMRPAATRRPVAARAEEESKSGGLVLGKKTFMEPSDSVIKGREQRARAGIYLAPGASEQSLSYLDGTLAGDYGFDPLGVMDPEGAGGVVTPEWLRYAEIIHARYAMLGAAGCIAPEILGRLNVIPPSTGLVWYKAGVIGPLSDNFEYWSDPYTIFFVQVILMQFAELRRLQDFKKPGSMAEQPFIGLEKAFKGSGDPCYPGGPIFNFLNVGKGNDELLEKLKLTEIKNGRLAMLAMFGYGAQAVLTGVSPVQNLIDHVQDPTHANIIGSLGATFGAL